MIEYIKQFAKVDTMFKRMSIVVIGFVVLIYIIFSIV
jgi:hypothetical protein